MKKINYQLISSITALVMCLALTITVSFAWFFSTNSINSTILMYSGDINLKSSLYIGYDKEKDGILEPVSELLIEPKSRTADLLNYYIAVDKNYPGGNEYDEINNHSRCIEGTYLTYKMIFINSSTNKNDATVAISFANLESYFYEYLDVYINNGPLTLYSRKNRFSENLYEVLGKNSARILFALDGFTAKNYTGESEDDFTKGFNNLVASSVEDDYNDNPNIRQIEMSTDQIYLWDASREENIVDGIIIKIGELVEIDFRLKCLNLIDVLYTYYEAIPNYVSQVEKILKATKPLEDETIKTTAEGYVNEMIALEIFYIFGSPDVPDKQLTFQINKIYAIGKSI